MSARDDDALRRRLGLGASAMRAAVTMPVVPHDLDQAAEIRAFGAAVGEYAPPIDPLTGPTPLDVRAWTLFGLCLRVTPSPAYLLASADRLPAHVAMAPHIVSAREALAALDTRMLADLLDVMDAFATRHGRTTYAEDRDGLMLNAEDAARVLDAADAADGRFPPATSTPNHAGSVDRGPE